MEFTDVMTLFDNTLRPMDEFYAMQRDWDKCRLQKRLAELFISSSQPVEMTENGNEIKIDSFLLAAILADSQKMKYTYRTDYSRLYHGVEKLITAPYTCTIVQISGSEKGTCKYKVHEKLKMEELGKMSYDQNAVWTKAIIDLFMQRVNYYARFKQVEEFAQELRKLYELFKLEFKSNVQ